MFKLYRILSSRVGTKTIYMQDRVSVHTQEWSLRRDSVVTEHCAAPISKVESRISDRCSLSIKSYTVQCDKSSLGATFQPIIFAHLTYLKWKSDNTAFYFSSCIVFFFLTRKGFDEESLPQMVQLMAAKKPQHCLRTIFFKRNQHIPVGLEVIVQFKI